MIVLSGNSYPCPPTSTNTARFSSPGSWIAAIPALSV
jgi:hypothetical protein